MFPFIFCGLVTCIDFKLNVIVNSFQTFRRELARFLPRAENGTLRRSQHCCSLQHNKAECWQCLEPIDRSVWKSNGKRPMISYLNWIPSIAQYRREKFRDSKRHADFNGFNFGNGNFWFTCNKTTDATSNSISMWRILRGNDDGYMQLLHHGLNN